MEIRKTTLQDVDTVLDVFAAAKRYMRANGNASQWGDEYPDRSIVTYDIACGSSYVMLENGEIVGTFAPLSRRGRKLPCHRRRRVASRSTLRHDPPSRLQRESAWRVEVLLRLLHRADRLSARPTRTRITARCSGFWKRMASGAAGVIHGAVDGGKRIAYDCIAHI